MLPHSTTCRAGPSRPTWYRRTVSRSTAYHAAGLTDLIDLSEIAVASELYPIARTMDLVATPDGLLAYPWSWSPLQIVYDPARVGHAIGSWDVLVDPRSRGRIVIEAQQMDLVLCAARAIGARDPLDMTDAELAKVTDWLTRLKPNVPVDRQASRRCHRSARDR